MWVKKDKTKKVGGKPDRRKGIMKDLRLKNVTAVLAKVIEVVSWFGAAMLIIMSVVLTVNRNLVEEIYTSQVMESKSITINSASAATSNMIVEGVFKGDAAFIFSPYAVVLVLTALIFMNVYNVFKKTNTASPFSVENVKRIRNIGYLAIAIPACKVVMALILMALMKFGECDLSISLSEVVFGLVALCLSQYFAYGVQLEKDVDGLL